MSTIQKRDSENQMPANAANDSAPQLKKTASSEPHQEKDVQEPHVSVRTSELIAAWGTGRFNADDAGDTDATFAAFAEFYAKDVILDASSAAHSGVPAYKIHRGFAGLKDWFDFVGGFSFEGVEMSHVMSPAPNVVWVRVSAATAVCKATSKSAPFECLNIITWEGDMVTKYTVVVYDPASVAAICSTDDVPMPSPVQLPTFEPHSSPMEPFSEMMALWGAGELAKAEMRNAHFVADAVDDLTDSALPDVLKAYRGIDGTGELLDHIAASWEMSNVDTGAVVAGLKPGCVMMLMTFDVKHKTTGKEASGVKQYSEIAYSADGKFVYARKYWVNAALLASIY